jgi:CTP synthase
MQLSVIEFARNVAGLEDANSTEFNKKTKNPVIYLLEQWIDNENKIQYRDEYSDMGGTMRLGAYECVLDKESNTYKAYQKERIFERHRHRYEFNNKFREILVKHGMKIVGLSPDGELVEVIEIEGHPWFVGCQFHPEFKSKPVDPHPLFRAFIKAAIDYK